MTKPRIRRLERVVDRDPNIDVRMLTDDQLEELSADLDPKMKRWIESLPNDGLHAIVDGVNLQLIAAIYGGPDE